MVIPAHILLKGYTIGIFPMADGKNGQISFYEANPRGVLDPNEFHLPKRLGRTYRQGKFITKFNTDFKGVIRGCANLPRGGCWISEEIIESYLNLHYLGFAHSVESWNGDRLAGGLYGVALGGMFFGESMFYYETDASKIALIALVERVKQCGMYFIDMQMLTDHMNQFGGKLVSKTEYMKILQKGLQMKCTFP